MIIVKYVGIFLILISSSFIGIIYSKRYSKRIDDLEEIKKRPKYV
jgi:septation ring formation regulator EzrA